ncbi:hypothetical protein EVAR_81176_1 [Eumeta japonica]|uniref:Uncharacterized protein n=1 Tax=Eumeta variegata TaxID=151549 RepID=A0A4C1UK40_EUMVA|nr:hypothetical protein EVAR_81176_1 [Eumeta japonica]
MGENERGLNSGCRLSEVTKSGEVRSGFASAFVFDKTRRNQKSCTIYKSTRDYTPARHVENPTLLEKCTTAGEKPTTPAKCRRWMLANVSMRKRRVVLFGCLVRPLSVEALVCDCGQDSNAVLSGVKGIGGQFVGPFVTSGNEWRLSVTKIIITIEGNGSADGEGEVPEIICKDIEKAGKSRKLDKAPESDGVNNEIIRFETSAVSLNPNRIGYAVRYHINIEDRAPAKNPNTEKERTVPVAPSKTSRTNRAGACRLSHYRVHYAEQRARPARDGDEFHKTEGPFNYR